MEHYFDDFDKNDIIKEYVYDDLFLHILHLDPIYNCHDDSILFLSNGIKKSPPK